MPRSELDRIIGEEFILSPVRRAAATLGRITDDPARDIEASWWRSGPSETACVLRHRPTGAVVGGRGALGHEYVVLAALLEELKVQVQLARRGDAPSKPADSL